MAARWVEVLRVDGDVWHSAWELFQNRPDKEWSFTECTSFTLMEIHGLHRAFAFDGHFQQAGMVVWPIPL